MSDKLNKEVFDENSFYIPDVGDGVSLAGHKTQCTKCHRKVLIQLPLFGVPHHFDALCVCANCLEIDSAFKDQYPEIANDLLLWKSS